MGLRGTIAAMSLLVACAGTPPEPVAKLRELKQQCFREQMALRGSAPELALEVNEICHRWAARAAR